MKTLSICASTLAFVGFALPAFAQPSAQPGQPGQPVAQPPAPEAPSNVDLGVLEDANSGRAWLAPTALTPPAGTYSLNDYELILIGGSYSPTDQIALSLTALAPLTEDIPLFLIASAKGQVLRQGNIRLAIQGAVTYASESDESFSVGTLGGAATICIDKDCHSHFNGYLGAGFLLSHADEQDAVPFLASVALIARLNRRIKLVIEADTGFTAGGDNADALLAWYGLRFTSRNIGVDLGFVRPVDFGDDDDISGGLVLGFPWVNFTYRGGPSL